MTRKITPLKADIALLSVTLFWGSTFILSKLALAEISLVSYLAVRLSMAAVFMILFSLKYIKSLDRHLLRAGSIMGVFLFLSYFFQMWGIKYTTASNAGFITGLNVVLVPVFSFLFFKDRPRLASLIGVGIATFGLFLLTGGNLSRLNIGDFLVLICSITVTFHVIYTGKFAPKYNVYLLTAVQLIVTALLSLVMLIIDRDPLPDMNTNVILVLIYLALFGTVYTFLMQTAMQRFTTATRTALIFSMEPVFAALFAFIIVGESLGLIGWIGGILILFAMLVAELDWTALLSRRKQ